MLGRPSATLHLIAATQLVGVLSCSRISWVTSAQVDDGIEKWIIGRIDIVDLMFITGVGEEKWYSEMDTRCMACVVRLLGEGISTVLLP